MRLRLRPLRRSPAARLFEAAGRPRVRLAAVAAVAGAGAAAGAARLIVRQRSDRRSRAYRLQAGEETAAGIRRIARGRADDALDQLHAGIYDDFPGAIHEARKDMKKIRSVLRLVRADLGKELRRRENERFRDAARLLAGARDAEVKLGTLEALRGDDSGLAREDVAPLLAALEAERDRHLRDSDRGAPVERAAAAIEAGREAIDAWPLESEGWALLEPGLERSYRRGRGRLGRAHDDPTDEAIHEWRKRVKDLWYQLLIVAAASPDELDPAAEEAHRLSELLGRHHDLAVLRDDALARRDLLTAADLGRLLDAIAARQHQLAAEAFELGERIYEAKPKAFAKRLRRMWER